MWWPSEMVQDRRETEHAEMIRRLNDAYAKLEAQRRAEEEAAWAEHERNGGNGHGTAK
jgi:hypothetical protein